MPLLHLFKEMGQNLLETKEGCSNGSFGAYIKLVRFFGYENLAVMLNHNTEKTWEGTRLKYYCKTGVVDAIYKEMGV